MPSPFATDADRDAFLTDPRQAILITHRNNSAPMGVPVWFDWTGEKVSMFAAKNTAKIRRLRNNPRASVLVTNHLGEPERWVAFDGDISISEEGGIELANRLAERYWDLNDPERKATLDQWNQVADLFYTLTMVPDKIRTGA